ncbi:hypothetical protein TH61_12765 [Rufibacter sp. DG15C]|uniref:hypothetical protein n=1 Tax=Rufibacter sp. DG15C TaxID=1379909 RepID=UPI00078EF5D6|nr:hypothetical protein [Rufibacter sp. DG15C]AMM51875.1 hypothetical protein TH61_12765 [Rufibacter sp. DG15C]
MQASSSKASYPALWLGALVILVLGVHTLIWGRQELSEMEQVRGPITHILKKHPAFPYKNDPKDRYLHIAGFDKAFNVYLGGDSDDFLPEFQSIAKLKVGDTVTVYYQESPGLMQSPGAQGDVIAFTYQIERGGQIHYLRGDSNVYLAYFLIFMGGLIAAVLFYYTYL